MSFEERKQEAIDAIEKVLEEYIDVLAPDIDLPVLSDWVVVTGCDSAVEPTDGATYRLHKRFQSYYRTTGLLVVAADEARGILAEDN